MVGDDGRLDEARELESAVAVCDASLDRTAALIDDSLLERGDRLRMLETIREFAMERLEESGEATEVRRRHAEHFLALAEQAQPHLRGSPREWLDRLQRDHDNLRTAFDWFEAENELRAAQLDGTRQQVETVVVVEGPILDGDRCFEHHRGHRTKRHHDSMIAMLRDIRKQGSVAIVYEEVLR